jgi:hypothetical protein
VTRALDSFEALVAMIQSLPVSHRRVAFALECDRLAREFNALVDDVAAAAKIARPK